MSAENSINPPEGNYDPNANGCLFFIPAFIHMVRQRYESAMAFYSQPIAAQDAETQAMIQHARYQAGVVVAAQEAGIDLPEEVIDDTYEPSHQPNPMYGKILDQALGNRINEVKQRNLEELLRHFQEGMASATPEEISEWMDSLSDK